MNLPRIYIPFLVFLLSSFQVFAVRYRYPSSLSSITPTSSTYCQGAAATALSVTVTNANCGVGGSGTDIPTTITWYSSTDASPSTPGDDIAVSGPSASSTATTVFTYTPSTASAGTLYYYYVITWADPDGAAVCVAGTLTSIAGQMATVIVNPTGAQTLTVTTTADAGAGSLRQAITDANAACGNATIVFNLGVGGPFTITINSTLPSINNTSGNSITIDGWENGTNDGSPNTVPVFNTLTTNPLDPVYKIILGNNNNVPTGLVISGNNNIIRGLVLPDFGDGTLSPNDIAITVSGNNNQILGCFIGMNDNGTTKGGARMYTGISISGGSNLIGNGTAAGANLISGVNGGSDGYGVVLTAFGATGNTVKGNIIGLQKDGSTIVATANQGMGVYMLPASGSGNIVGGTVAGEGNVISGNTFYGVGLVSSVGGNFARGNIIGPRADGATYVTSNTQVIGIWLSGSPGNTIGGNSVNTRNIISGNETTGIYVNTSLTTGNSIKGNYIGINKTGTAFITGSTQNNGIYITNLAVSNTIGGGGVDEGNVISGNTSYGIFTNSVAAGGNTIIGNIIGTQADGITYLASSVQTYGILISSSPDNTIGGNTVGVRNIISANDFYGISIGGPGSNGNLVKGNYIGIDKNGTTFIAGSSQNNGIEITGTAANNTLGGTGAGEGNVISGNSSIGVYLNSGPNLNSVIGNIIGPQANGTTYLASNVQDKGIHIASATNTTIGGNTVSARNIISANETYGIFIQDVASTGNLIKGNYIGIAGNGTSYITGSTQDYGVYFSSSAGSGNTIGGSAAGEGNVISGNFVDGISLNSTAAGGTLVQGNIIGTQADGLTFISSFQGNGISIVNSLNNTIGGNTALTRNIISGNTTYGVQLSGPGSTGNIIKGNYIGIAANGTTFITGSSQDYGVGVFSPSNTIGGTGAGEGNVCSGNINRGVSLGPGSSGNNVIGNIIGPQADGLTYLSSNQQAFGIGLYVSATGNTIGGSTPAERNIISANEQRGIFLQDAGTTANAIKGNYIGPSASLTNIAGSSQDYGLYINNNTASNTIGGAGAGEANQIAFNTLLGVYLIDAATTGNLISRNPIYSNTGKPIELNYGASQANNGKPAPDVTTATATYVIGTSEAGNTVEVFKNTTGNCYDAATYLGTAIADGSGNWTLSGLSLSASDYILATATNGTNNTSEFSGCDTVIDLAISTSAIAPAAYCAGAAVSVPYTISGSDNFNGGNIFTAQLSDAAGNFAAPTNIGTLASTLSGTIAATIPPATPAGAGYRIRVISSDPSIIGTDNVTNLSVSTSAPAAPSATAATAITCGSFNANWTAAVNATTYYLDVATDIGFTSFVTGYNNLDVGNVIIKAVTGLAGGTTYFYRVRSYNACGASGNSNTETATTLGVPGIFTVDNLGDIDNGLVYTLGDLTNSLRKCIRLANANCGHDIINFNLGAGGPFTLLIDAALPNLTDNDGATIDGWENVANDGSPNTVPVFNTLTTNPLDPIYKIILGNNNNVPTGLILASNNNIIKGLVIQDFGDGTLSSNDIAITITGNTNKVIGNYIGMDAGGTTRGTKTVIGISVSGASNKIGDGTAAGVNLISGMNGGAGVDNGIYFTGAGATGNSVKGNMIGLQKDGTSIVAGAIQTSGVQLFSTSGGGNTIGGSASGEGNVISGNGTYGVGIIRTAAAGDTVIGNIIGPRADGVTNVTSNAQVYGVFISGSPNNIVGGNTSITRNIISANLTTGVQIQGGASTGNVIKGNYIGIDKTGTTYMAGNSQDWGVYIADPAISNIIGGSGAGEGNVISGNNTGLFGSGVHLFTVAPGGNTVLGNIIGPQADGNSYLASNTQNYGMYVAGPDNIIGGNTTGARNIISGNQDKGITLNGNNNIIKGNYIGIAKNGASIITGNPQLEGIRISGVGNSIGGTGSGEGNIVSGNSSVGIFITSGGAAGNTLVGNTIGPQADGSTHLAGNVQFIGLRIANSPNNIIGGNTASARNIISDNQTYGLSIWGATSTGNVVKGNYIGIAKNGSSFITGNTQSNGVEITTSAASNTIGGTGAGEGNLISGNTSNGIYLVSSAAAGNTIIGNIIGPQSDGNSRVTSNAQSFGFYIFNSPNNIIGGNTASARNIISANETYGIDIQGASSTGNIIKGNYIGIDKNGTSFITGSSQDRGIYLESTSGGSNTIGGSAAGEGNLISGNSEAGVWINSSAAAGNTVTGNIIGPQSDGLTYLASNAQSRGVVLSNSPNNIVGGNTVLARNIISANENYGVWIGFSGSNGNIIKGNYIGPNSALGTIAGSSQDYGFYIVADANNNTIGGTGAGEENIIALNTTNGIYLYNTPTVGNKITRNPIYSNTGKAINLNYGVNQGNNGKAVPVISSVTATTVSGTSGAGNTIEIFKNTTGPTAQDAVTYLGNATADGAGIWSLGGLSLVAGEFVVATATDGTNNTSELAVATCDPQIYTVNSTNDVNDGLCDGAHCSLREAINAANANCGHDTVVFNLGGGGPFTIALTSALPNLTDNRGATIDGFRNTGNNGTPNTVPVFSTTVGTPMDPVYKIILGNTPGTIATGLVLASDSNEIKGLVLQDFGDGTPSANDIAITVTGNVNKIIGNNIGMDAAGTTRGTRTYNGIYITGANNLIGNGTASGANLISGINNAGWGIFIQLVTGTGNSIKGNILGLQKDGSTIVAGALQATGVYVTGLAYSNTIGGTGAGEGNVISGNTNTGILINTTPASGNSVLGNIIGPQANGTGNVSSNAQSWGIYIANSPNNIIGGNSAGSRNIISANEDYGISLFGAASTGNVIKGNYIGIDKNGTTFITGSSQSFGVYIYGSAVSNSVGGSGAGEGNVISGNSSTGILFSSLDAAGNSVIGNIIGPQADGITYLASNVQQKGIEINNSPNNTIGGNIALARNIISANESSGLYITGASSTGNIVKGNYIGIDKNGTTFITGSTQDYGIYILTSAASSTIGGSGAGDGNVISGNKDGFSSGRGIFILSSAVAGNSILGNIIGPQADGITYLASNAQFRGIELNGSPNNTIGGNTALARNVISANEMYGIYIFGAGSTGNVVKGNYIGIDKNGTTFITGSTQDEGLRINAAASNTIGGTGAGEGNVFSGNNNNGIAFVFVPAAGNSIIGNIIGPQADGITYLASHAQGTGVWIYSSTNNIIGGTTAAERNIISANIYTGVRFENAVSTGNILKGNYVGPGSTLANIPGSAQDQGVSIDNGASNNFVGGSAAGEANQIAFNTVEGIGLFVTTTTGNLISRNPIYSNTGKPINLNYGAIQGNNGIAFPVITSASSTTVSGTSGAGNIIEVFKNTTTNCFDATVYVGTTTADGSGNWSLGGLSLVAGDYVLANATDGTNNTSEFSTCQLATPPPNTITTSAIAPATLCRGGTITVSYTITGTYNAGNVFTAQLSDATGSFATPTAIGNVTSTTNTDITATIPIGTSAGAGYRIRVVSSDPAVTGSNNGANLTVPSDGGAGTWTWVGGISNNWFDRCNWDKKSLPDLSSDVVIPGGTANDPNITGAAANCKTITIDTGNGGIVNLNSSGAGVLNVAQ